jgi:hypothetical protein
MDQEWPYTRRVDTRDFSEAPNNLPEGMTPVIALGWEMDPDSTATYRLALAGAKNQAICGTVSLRHPNRWF